MKKIVYISLMPLLMLLPVLVKAQEENAAIREGNKLYHDRQFEKAMPAYQKAIQQNPKNLTASFNLANARFRTGNMPDAEKAYDDLIENTTENKYKEKGYYNKGVTFTKQQKLQESIDAYKDAIKLDPTDEDARFNLQKALTEQRKQNQSQQQQKQPQQKQQKQKPENNKLDKKKIEQYLKSLEQKEQDVQRKMQQNRARSVTQPEKDW